MNLQFIKVTGKVTAETFGCDEIYFKKHIKGKPLRIIHSTSNHYVRAQDENQEEWGLFPGQYTLVTGLEDAPTAQAGKAKKAKLLR